jgi:hypothetical protein
VEPDEDEEHTGSGGESVTGSNSGSTGSNSGSPESNSGSTGSGYETNDTKPSKPNKPNSNKPSDKEIQKCKKNGNCSNEKFPIPLAPVSAVVDEIFSQFTDAFNGEEHVPAVIHESKFKN